MNVSLAVWEHQPQNSQQLLMPIIRLVFGLKDSDDELSQALQYPVCVLEVAEWKVVVSKMVYIAMEEEDT